MIKTIQLSWLTPLGMMLICLKLAGVIHWSWLWVTCPFWLPLALFITVALFIFVIGFLIALFGA